MILHSLRHSALAALTLAALALAACSSEAPSPAPDETKGDVTLRLKVAMGLDGDAGSRADAPDSYEPGIGDFESVSTLRVIILHDSRKVEGNRMVATDAKGNPLNDNLEFKVASNELKWVYLIANEASLPLPSDPGRDVRTVSEWLDSYAVGQELPLEVMQSWTAGYTNQQLNSQNVTSSLFKDKERLPLTEVFRLQTVKIPHPDYSTDSGSGSDDSGVSPNDISQTQEARLFMTRAAAKATFFFNLSGFQGMGGTITGVRLSGLSQREYVFPRYTSATTVGSAVYSPEKYTGTGINGDESSGEIKNVDKNQRYIKAFDSPSSNSVITYTLDGANFGNPIKLLASSGNGIQRGAIYFPESSSTLQSGAYKVQIQRVGSRWLDAQPLATNILEFDGHQAIARNTHLKINISVGTDNSIFYDVEPLPWTPETYEFDYTEQIGVASDGLLNFETGTYASLDKNSGRLVLRNYPDAVKGSFGISTPLGARWDAYLITQSGEQNAIQFLLPDGNTTTHITGSVGTKVDFSVAPTSAAGTTARHAILQVMVTMPSGLSVPARAILGNDYGKDVQFVTFIQNPQ